MISLWYDFTGCPPSRYVYPTRFLNKEGSLAIALRNTSRDRDRDQNRDQTRINDRIRISPIRVISAEGEQLGVLPTDEALSIAREAGLDLVEVAPGAKPPVCRIMDYGKYKYQQSKKQHKNQSHHTKTKEIRLRPKTGDHDIEFKVKQAISFLKHKDKVQVSIQFKGREMAHVEEGHRVMAQVIELLAEVGKVESPPKQMGRRIMATVSPKAG